jgi:hypothetical protein
MTDAEIIAEAKARFVLDTPTERLARELIGVAERAIAINASATCLYCEQTKDRSMGACSPVPRGQESGMSLIRGASRE